MNSKCDLEHFINQSIYVYPILYRVKANPRLSRLLVLDQIFFTNGNGYEWNKKKGVLLANESKLNIGLKELPCDFFEKENIEYINFDDIHPYPICEYSAIAEIIEGKTHEISDQEYSFREYPIKKQWVDACAELAAEALKFYSDPERYKNDDDHPDKIIKNYIKDFRNSEEAGSIEKYRSERNYLENETVEEKCVRDFEEYRQEQIGYLKKFLEMWKNNQIPTKK